VNHRYWASAVALFLCLGCEDSIRLTYLPEPPSSAQMELSSEAVKALEEKHPGKDGIYLDQSMDFEIMTSPALASLSSRSHRYLVLNRMNESLSRFSVSLKPGHELEKVQLVHRRPDGKVLTYGISDLKEERDSDGTRTLKFIYPNVEKGSVISEQYLVRNPSPRLGDLIDNETPLQWQLPCEHVRFRFMHPEAWEGQVKRLGPDRELPVTRTVSEAGKKVIYTFEANQVPGLDEELFAPSFKERSSYFKINFSNIPTLRYAGPTSWKAFQREFSAYAVDKEALISTRVRDTALEVTKGCQTDEARLDAIITWIQENITPGSLPDTPNFADMLAKKHANPYQATGLARSMLSKMGISSDYLMLHSQYDGWFDPAFISFGEISSPALRVRLGDRVHIVFPWVKGLPVNHLPEAFQGSKALLVGPDTPSDAIQALPEGNLASNSWEERYQVTLDEDGRATVQEEKVLSGSAAFGARQALRDLGKEETEKFLRKLLTYSEGEVKFTSVGFEHREDARKPLVIRLVYTVDNLITLTPEEAIFNTAGLFSPSSSLKTKVDPTQRQSPIRIYYDEARIKRVALSFPKTWTLQTPLKDHSVSNGFGSLTLTQTSEAGRLQVDQTLQFRKSATDPSRLQELLALTGRRSQMAIPSLTFKIKG